MVVTDGTFTIMQEFLVAGGVLGGCVLNYVISRVASAARSMRWSGVGHASPPGIPSTDPSDHLALNAASGIKKKNECPSRLEPSSKVRAVSPPVRLCA
jgi:hypothetical protein